VQLDPTDPRVPSRPLWGLLILALPLVGLVLVVMGYGSVFLLGLQGRQAGGERVILWYGGCPEAKGAVVARLADMGLQAEELPVPPGQTDKFGFSLHLPSDPLAAASLPATLASPGRLELLAGSTVLADERDLREASVRMDLLTQPSLLLSLDEDATARVREHVGQDQQGELTLRIDNVAVASQSNERAVQEGGIELIPSREGKSERERWAAVAAWAVTVDHTLPCSLTLLEEGSAAAAAPGPEPASPTR
jgi:hypothetical protein